jgi:hypothetical protein
LVSLFLEVTHSQDEAQALAMLEMHGWALDRAVVSMLATGPFLWIIPPDS